MTENEFSPLFEQINYDITNWIKEKYKADGTVKERFFSWWKAFVTFANERPFDLIYMDEITNSHLYAKMGEQPSTAYYFETRNIYKKGMEEGSIKQTDPSWINQFVRSGLTNVVKINLARGKKLEENQIDWMVQACWDAIKVE